MRVGLLICFLLCSGFFGMGRDNRQGGATTTPSIGLQVGEKAPNFKLRDQFDHDQSSESLKGSNGTVLLFFRSADW